MKIILVILVWVTCASAQEAPSCDHVACQLPDCRCSSVDIPGGLEVRDTPQFVTVSFDGALTAALVDSFYLIPFLQRHNPDGCQASMAFFVSHEYTDYTKVNEMYAFGHEIALNSITRMSDISYWQTATANLLSSEFSGQRQMTAHFANIPQTVMRGIRSPYFQMAGDATFQMLAENDFVYDYGWPTQNFVNPGLWPYTLDYASMQDCSIGPCPTGSFPGVWVIPVPNWFDNMNVACAMADGCTNVPDTEQGIFEYMVSNFERHYLGNRSPFPISLHGSWFLTFTHAFAAYIRFLEYLAHLPDVYLVGPNKVIEWVRNPIAIGELRDSSWTSCNMPSSATPCFTFVCPVFSSFHGFTQFMNQCTASCPNVYPWINNPLGQ